MTVAIKVLPVNLSSDASLNRRLGIWKDADPDIPILKQAKAEYAKLQ